MRAPGLRPAMRLPRIPGAVPRRGMRLVPMIAVLITLQSVALGGCDRGRSRADVDPLCGDVAGRLPASGLPLARVPLDPPLVVPARHRRHAIRGRTRDTVTGFRRIPLPPRRLEGGSGPRHVERVPADERLAGESVVYFVPHVRLAEGDWVALDWVEAVPRRDADRTVYEVAFDLPSPDATVDGDRTAPAGAVEIRLDALASSARAQHAWESEAFTVPADAVLATAVGIVEGGRDAGPVAFRALACEGEHCACLHAEVIDAAADASDASRAPWRERRISLARQSGRSVSIRLETQALRDGAGDPGLWATPMLLRREPAGAPRRPNLLLISLDTLAADHLGVYGYPRDTSPYIDRTLAPRGTVFLDAAAPATTTGPSHMTLFTSLPPSVHGFVSNLGGQRLPDAVPTLALVLREAGYVTGAVTENGAISRWLGFGRGFDSYEENLSAEVMRPEGHVESTFRTGLDFVDRVQGLPWFLFLHTYQVHFPYTPPPDYATLFEGDGLDPFGVDALFVDGRSQYAPVLYDREIRYTDDRLRDLLGALDRAGLLTDTIVVVLADHGEAFLQHTYLGHGADLHRETVRVPLILAGPGVPAGLRIATRVGLGDVMPTVLDLLGVPAPDALLGRSLLPLLDGETTADVPVFSEAWQTLGVTRTGGVDVVQPTLAVQSGRYKLIRYREGEGHRDALFDLEHDPFEHEDLAADGRVPEGDAARHLGELSRLLDAYARDSARRAEALGVVPDASPAESIDPERLEKLRALGYVQ